MAIWLRAREEFTDNRFQLLFIYIDIDKAFTSSGHTLGESRLVHLTVGYGALPISVVVSKFKH